MAIDNMMDDSHETYELGEPVKYCIMCLTPCFDEYMSDMCKICNGKCDETFEQRRKDSEWLNDMKIKFDRIFSGVSPEYLQEEYQNTNYNFYWR